MIIRSLVNNCGLPQLGFFWDQVCTPERDPVKLKVGVVLDAVFRCVCAVDSQKEPVPDDYSSMDPEHRLIYRFVRTLFSAAQLTVECAIVTLVSFNVLFFLKFLLILDFLFHLE